MNNTTKTFVISVSLLAILIFVIWGLGKARLPLLLAFGIAYLIFPIIRRLETRGIHRNHAVLGVFLLSTLTSLTMAAILIPGLVADGDAFLQELPSNTARAMEKISGLGASFGFNLNLSQEGIRTFIVDHASEISAGVLKSFSQGFLIAFSDVTKWLLNVLSFFLIPLFFFYIINDYEKIQKDINSFIPPAVKPRLNHYLKLCNDVLSGYIRGQLMVALVLAFMYALGLTLVGLKFGFLIGFVSGLLVIIPYAGFTLGFTAAILMTFATNGGSGLFAGVVIVYLLNQALESFVITPRLVGEQVGLSALATMLALIIGGNLAGLVGMLVAIPTAAIMKSILADLKKEYRQLEMFKGK